MRIEISIEEFEAYREIWRESNNIALENTPKGIPFYIRDGFAIPGILPIDFGDTPVVRWEPKKP